MAKKLSFEIGGYSNQLQALNEAKEFCRTDVFTRRSGIMPDPVDFGLEIKFASAVPQPWSDPPSPLNQFYVLLKLDVEGPTEERIDEWAKKVNAAINIHHASSVRKPGEMGERAEHLKFMAEQKAKSKKNEAKTS